MITEPPHLRDFAASAKRIAMQLLAMGQTRLELITVEVQEERERYLYAIVLALGCAAFGLLAGVALTFALVMLMWEHSPVITLLCLFGIYAGTAGLLYARLNQLRRNWQTLPATLDQMKKDRECLEELFQ